MTKITALCVHTYLELDKKLQKHAHFFRATFMMYHISRILFILYNFYISLCSRQLGFLAIVAFGIPYM